MNVEVANEQSVECIQVDSAESRVLYSEDYEVDAEKCEEVPFPYVSRQGKIVTQLSQMPRLKPEACKRELRASKTCSALDSKDLQQQYKWRKQFDDEPQRKGVRRALERFISFIRPVPTASDCSVF
mmetsp:Transcript_61664/g.165675  ORF Transcript_61664/g.165675 Transcript_61664/m.165675 type:complete len:126 (-) Transcript_61664:32-409(-)